MTSEHSGLRSIRGGANSAPPHEHADRILRRDEHLFHAGRRLTRAYLVVAGVLKSYVLHENGDEQVLDFHLPGDVVGLDALMNEPAYCSVMALDTSSVRELAPPAPDDALLAGRADAALVLAGMHKAIRRLSRRLHTATTSTDQRLARYLLEFADAQDRRGCSRRQLRLPMRRRDLACYLGLATETLSRTFTRLQQQGLIEVDNYDVELLDPEGLRCVASAKPTTPCATAQR